jgi:hypothetical protein
VTSELIAGAERAKLLFGRRDLFAVFAIAAGAAVVAPRTASVSAAFADAGDDCGQSRYKETEHIKTLYEVNRL